MEWEVVVWFKGSPIPDDIVSGTHFTGKELKRKADWRDFLEYEGTDVDVALAEAKKFIEGMDADDVWIIW